jgi:cephalosporin hydroxylase
MGSFISSFDPQFLSNYQRGVMSYTYRDRPCLKSPIDLSLYLRLLWSIKPATLIEIGSKEGGAALWFADMTSIYGLKTKIVSIDICPPTDLLDERIEFLTGDVEHLEDCLTPSFCRSLPRPWFIIEDSSHQFLGVMAALDFFSKKMQPLEMMVVEDGILDELDLQDLYQGGPNRAIAEFMRQNESCFRIDRESCDFFGRNATYAPNGYLIKI